MRRIECIATVLTAVLVATGVQAAPTCPRNVLPELCQNPLDNDVEMTSDANGNAIISVFGGVVRIKTAEKMPIPLHLHEAKDQDSFLGKGVLLTFMTSNLTSSVTYILFASDAGRDLSAEELDSAAAKALAHYRDGCEAPRTLGPAKPYGTLGRSWEWTCTSKRMFTSNTEIYRSMTFMRKRTIYVVNNFALATPSAITPKIIDELRIEIAPP